MIKNNLDSSGQRVMLFQDSKDYFVQIGNAH